MDGSGLPRIFISYRRDDAAADAGRLADHLQRRFGRDRVFMDVDTIEAGADFHAVLRRSLSATVATLVVIGHRWAGATTADGRRRLDDPADFVRIEVETALAGAAPVIPVLVQGARLPDAAAVPPSLAPLLSRQAASLDHAEFHADAERLASRLEALVGPAAGGPRWKRWAAAALALAVLVSGVAWAWRASQAREAAQARARAVEALVTTAGQQQARRQFADALATLAEAGRLDAASPAVRTADADVAMQWIREAIVRDGETTFGASIAPALAVVDRLAATATGVQKADLVAHQGWATFLLWRDGERQLRPDDRYREALAIDPGNPYANAMLAHWTLWQRDDLREAVRLFETAARASRAGDVVRQMQWAAYGNERTPAAYAELLKVADRMRQNREPLTARQAQTLWAAYYFSLRESADRPWDVMRQVLSPEDHGRTLAWAFDDYVARDTARQQTLRFYQALLHADAGRQDLARTALDTLAAETGRDAGSLPDAIRAARRRLGAPPIQTTGRATR